MPFLADFSLSEWTDTSLASDQMQTHRVPVIEITEVVGSGFARRLLWLVKLGMAGFGLLIVQ